MDTVTFLGTGDSMGVPRVYCDCGICSEARTGGTNRRLRSSVWIETGAGPLLIDCGPDWKAQMEFLGQRFIGDVLITHAHHDHIGGLPEWADACRWLKRKGSAYAPKEVLMTLRERFPWLERFIVYRDNDDGFTFGEWRIQPWRVNHGKNGHSYAYLFTSKSYRWAYCSDAINLSDSEKGRLFGLDLLVLGTNFYKEEADVRSRSVYDMVEALALLAETKPARAVFTHMSHGVDITAAYPLPPNVQLARTGMTIPLQKE